MKLLFIADPLEGFKPTKDSTLAMMKASWQAGHQVFHAQGNTLGLKENLVSAVVCQLEIYPTAQNWYGIVQQKDTNLCEFDVVLMRQDPPFDIEYLTNTWLLSRAESTGVRVVNSSVALREHSEKIAILEFPEFTAPTLVTRSLEEIRQFHIQYKDVVIKPLDGMGGMGIFRVGVDGLNLASIVETLGQNGIRSLMAQQYIPEITQGDKRILLINGKPLPYVLARIPQEGDIRGNLAAGGKGVAQAISKNDLKIAEKLGPILQKRGLFLVGLDVIGNYLTEINVTSPTCFVEISEQTDFDVAKHWLVELELLLASK